MSKRSLYCTVEGCDSVFYNASNRIRHERKFHKIEPTLYYKPTRRLSKSNDKAAVQATHVLPEKGTYLPEPSYERPPTKPDNIFAWILPNNNPNLVFQNNVLMKDAYTKALLKNHPDRGGAHDDFLTLHRLWEEWQNADDQLDYVHRAFLTWSKYKVNCEWVTKANETRRREHEIMSETVHDILLMKTNAKINKLKI
jgi:hypothetical protein